LGAFFFGDFFAVIADILPVVTNGAAVPVCVVAISA
jgi:hypothetical protein